MTRTSASTYAIVAALALCAARDARGQATNPAAQALFEEGRTLLEAGKLDQACSKFSESYRLFPFPGALLNLADCHERQGKLATAWAEFQSTERLAQTQGRASHAAEAARRAALVAPKVPYVIVRADETPAGLVVKLGPLTLGEGSLGSRLPMDPGEHEVSAEAPDRLAWSSRVRVEAGGADREVRIPRLAPRAPAPGPTSAPVAASGPPVDSAPRGDDGASRRTLAYAAGGLGVVALGVGAYFGLSAQSAYKRADEACPTHVGCSDAALADRSSAGDRATVADIGVGVGLVAISASAILWLTAPTPARATIAPTGRGGSFAVRF